ncbi:hypothetical protein [Saccharopolyspora sp. NPDC049426]
MTALRHVDDFFTALIERIRTTTPPPAAEAAPEESTDDSDESQ